MSDSGKVGAPGRIGRRDRCRLYTVVAVLALIAGCHRKPAVIDPVAKSRVSNGNLARLHRAMAKRGRGPITIAFLGGSITRGQGASDEAHCYAELATDWWGRQSPPAGMKYLNAGVSGTGSNYGCLRVAEDVIAYHPDVVVVEFGVNDPDELAAAETYEGVVRQLVADPDAPAVILLFMMHHTGTNAQDFQSRIGRQYGLPMVSSRDAWWPEIAAGRSQWTDFYADSIHPNDRGHKEVSRCLTLLFDDALKSVPAVEEPVSTQLPTAVFTDSFARVEYRAGEKLVPVDNDGWTAGKDGVGWESDEPGSTISFEVGGGTVEMVYQKAHAAMGVVRVTVDDGPTTELDGWFEPTWGPVPETVRLASGLSKGVHKVRVEVAEEHNPASTGDRFRIIGVGGCDR